MGEGGRHLLQLPHGGSAPASVQSSLNFAPTLMNDSDQLTPGLFLLPGSTVSNERVQCSIAHTGSFHGSRQPNNKERKGCLFSL